MKTTNVCDFALFSRVSTQSVSRWEGRQQPQWLSLQNYFTRKSQDSEQCDDPTTLCVTILGSLACNTVGKDRIKYQNICRCGHDEHFVDLQHVLDKR